MRIYKVGDNLATILPKNIIDKLKLQPGDEIEFYEVKPGIVLVKKEKIEGMLRQELGDAEAPGSRLPGMEEMELLKKLNSIKFSERIPYNVNKKLNPREKEVLSRLIEKGSVIIYKDGKYSKTGVYEIPRATYTLLKGERPEARELTAEEKLEKYGYLIIDDAREAEVISKRLEASIKSGEIMGTRGFDRRFYVGTRVWLIRTSERLKQSLRKGTKSASDLSRELKTDESSLKAALEIMRDKGDIIEKRRGCYELV